MNENEQRKIALDLSIWYFKEVVGKPIFIDKDMKSEAKPASPDEVVQVADKFYKFIHKAEVPE